MEQKSVLSGFAVAIAERGFVFVGEVVCDGEWCVVTNAKNVRRWGTTKGLGEIAANGPTDKTVLDDAGTVRIPRSALITLIDADGTKWTR